MKSSVVIFFVISFFGSISVKAKFSVDVFNIPCEEVKLEIKTCRDHSFSKYWGAMVTGEIQSQGPIKCHANQKMNLSKYKKAALKNKFFVEGLKCKQKEKVISTIKPNWFCDTPGATSIKECLVTEISYTQKLTYLILQ